MDEDTNVLREKRYVFLFYLSCPSDFFRSQVKCTVRFDLLSVPVGRNVGITLANDSANKNARHCCKVDTACTTRIAHKSW